MTYATIMVHLELGCRNVGALSAARDLADRFDARVVGITACQPIQAIYNDACYVSAELVEQDRAQIQAENTAAEAEFCTTLEARAGLIEWRSTLVFEPLAGYLAAEARCADIVITSAPQSNVPNGSRRVNTGDFVMQVGRPVLVVPAAIKAFTLDRVAVAWKDTRESRRATQDALPLLRKARQVSIFSIADETQLAASRAQLDDVARWLQRHGVAASTRVHASSGSDAAQLQAIIGKLEADVLVAGAYGHSRLREWAFGGVTRDLLLQGQRCALVSH